MQNKYKSLLWLRSGQKIHIFSYCSLYSTAEYDKVEIFKESIEIMSIKMLYFMYNPIETKLNPVMAR